MVSTHPYSPKSSCIGDKTETLHCCTVCASLPLRSQCCDMNSALMNGEGLIYNYFDGGVLELATTSLKQESENAPRVNRRAASKAAALAQKHLSRLQHELASVGLLKQETQNYLGPDDRARVMAPLNKSEIVLGARIGSGGFASVYEVHSFRLSKDEHNSMKISDEERAAREYLKCHAEKPLTPCPSSYSSSSHKYNNSMRAQARYVVKHLRYSLAEDHHKFEKAAVDLTLEAQLLLVTDHPNIVSIRGWAELGTDAFKGGSPSDYFIILDCLPELLEDRIFAWRQQMRKYRSKCTSKFSLAFWNRKRNMSKFQNKLNKLFVERLQVAHDISSGLEYLHGRRVMHRDVKTSNIGFDGEGVVQIFDLGLARLLPKECDSMHDGYVMSCVGTRSTMAPEVAAKKAYGTKADVYSFGVVLWEIMTLSTASDYFRMTKQQQEQQHHPHPHHEQQQQPCNKGGTSSLSKCFNNSQTAANAGAGGGATVAGATVLTEQDVSLALSVESDCVLPICPCWPQSLQDLVRSCLAHDPAQRPCMTQVRQALLSELKALGCAKIPCRRRRSTFRLDLTKSTAASTTASTLSQNHRSDPTSAPLASSAPANQLADVPKHQREGEIVTEDNHLCPNDSSTAYASVSLEACA